MTAAAPVATALMLELAAVERAMIVRRGARSAHGRELAVDGPSLLPPRRRRHHREADVVAEN